MKKLPILLFWLLLCACFTEPADKGMIPDNLPGGKLLIQNEGNFQWGNAGLSLYHLDQKSMVSTNLFQSVNGRPLGDVLQSARVIGNEIWLVVNNTGTLELIDRSSYVSTRSIPGFVSPRYLCPLNNDQVAVSDLYSDSVSVIRTGTGMTDYKVFLKGWTEEMALVENKLWVSNPNAYKMYAIDLQTRQLSDSVEIGFGSFALKSDDGKNLWIATRGNKDLGIPSMIHGYSPSTGQFFFSKEVGTEPVQDLFLDDNNRVWYLYRNQLFRFKNSADQLPDAPVYDGTGRNLYAADFVAGRIAISDAVDYVQNGEILLLDTEGNVLERFKAGRIPNGFIYLP